MGRGENILAEKAVKKVRLGEFFDLQMGKTPARDNPAYWGGCFKWASISDIGQSDGYLVETKETITQQAIEETGIKPIPPNTLVMSFKLSVGKTAITTEQMFSNEAIMAFLPRVNNDFDLHFLYHQFSYHDWGKGCNKAVKGITLNKATLSQHQIFLPPIIEQRHIAAVLDKICELKKNAEARIEKLNLLVKSRFVEMFGDTRSNSKALPVRRLDSVCSSIVRGPFGSALKKEFFVAKGCNTYKVYEQKHAIQKNATIGSYYIDANRFSELRRFECKPGDVIMSCSGTMGEFFQLPVGCEQGVMNQALCKFSLSDAVLPVYFLNYMKNAIGLLRTQGSGIQNIAAVSYVKSMPFLLPPLALQREFAGLVAKVDKLAFEAKKCLETVETLYRAKLQEVFG